MLKFLKKRSGAILVCVLVIILSTLLSAHRSLSTLRNEVETMLVTGVDGGGAGIESDLTKRIDYAGNLITIAKKYDGFDAEISALSDARTALIETKGSASEKYHLNNGLTEAFDMLSSVMQGELAEKDESYRVEISENFRSREDTLVREAARYNAKAREYNYNVLGAFPANFIKYPAFVSELPLFA